MGERRGLWWLRIQRRKGGRDQCMQSENKKGVCSPRAKPDGEGKRRCKRLPRSPNKEGRVRGDVAVEKKRGRGGEEVDMDVDDQNWALKIGKLSGALEDGNGKKAGRRTGPAGTNEDHGLELPGICKFPSSSGASEVPEVRGGGYPLLVRDKTR